MTHDIYIERQNMLSQKVNILSGLMHSYISIPNYDIDIVIGYAKLDLGIDVESYDDISLFLEDYDNSNDFNFNDWLLP